jgi:hypothetical protein
MDEKSFEPQMTQMEWMKVGKGREGIGRNPPTLFLDLLSSSVAICVIRGS